MIPEPPPNFITRPYRGLSVQDVDVPLTPAAITEHILGREVYRRTDFLVLRNAGRAAIVGVRRQSDQPLFSPVAEARVLAGPDEVVWIDEPDVDPGNATALAATALRHQRPGAAAYVVKGRWEHINFIWKPSPVRVRVTEVVPPEPAKLLAMARQVVDFDGDLPPIELVLDAVDIRRLAAGHPAPGYLLPCRGSGVDLGAEVTFLDTRPAKREDWLLIGCDRCVQFHEHFFGDEPARVDICPFRRAAEDAAGPPTLTKCCQLERGVEFHGSAAIVPWGSNLDEVRFALRALTGVGPAPDVSGVEQIGTALTVLEA